MNFIESKKWYFWLAVCGPMGLIQYQVSIEWCNGLVPNRQEVIAWMNVDQDTWLHMMTSSNGNIFRVTGPFCWVPRLCGIEGNEIVDQLAKETLDHDIDPLATVHYADLKPVVNSYIQQEVQIKWGVSIHGRNLYLLKPTLGPPKKFKHLTRAEEVVITRLRIGHTKASKSHILSRGPPTACQHCGQTLTIEHMLLECTVLQQIRD